LASSTQVNRNGTEVPLRRCRAPIPVTVVVMGCVPTDSSVRSIVSQGMPSSSITPKAASDWRVSMPTFPAQREMIAEEMPPAF
jgi:hypothetical protein